MNKSNKKGPPSPRGRTRSSVQLHPTTPTAPTPTLERTPSLLEQRRRSALTKLKGLVIPENNESLTSSNSSVESPKNVVLPTPPWKSSNSTLPKYSPAFKRKPFTLYGNQAAVKPGPEQAGPKPKPAERRFPESSQPDEKPKVPKRLSVSSTSSSTHKNGNVHTAVSTFILVANYISQTPSQPACKGLIICVFSKE